MTKFLHKMGMMKISASFPPMELTPGLFRSLHPGIQAYRLISANQYYILWHTLNKMNNDLQFIVRYHPWRAAAKHTGIITVGLLLCGHPPCPQVPAFDQTPPLRTTP